MDKGKNTQIIQMAVIVLLLLGIIYLLALMSPFLAVIFIFLKTILSPFLIAMIISYLLNPIVNLLSQNNVPRSFAVLFIYSIFILSLIILIVNMVPILGHQVRELMEQIPEWNQQLTQMMRDFNQQGAQLLPDSIRLGIEKALVHMEVSISQSIEHMMGELGDLLNQLFIAFIIPFLAFYMLKDAHAIEKSAMSIFPIKERRALLRLFRKIDQALASYIRGQLLVSLIVGVLAYFGYMMLGMPYPLLLAFMVSIFNVIPYLGPIFGAIPAVFVAMVVAPQKVLAVIILNLIVQVLEGNIISPSIVGRNLHLHPLLIIFVLLVGGELGGIWGLILAVPSFVIIKVISEHVITHYVNHKKA